MGFNEKILKISRKNRKIFPGFRKISGKYPESSRQKCREHLKHKRSRVKAGASMQGLFMKRIFLEFAFIIASFVTLSINANAPIGFPMGRLRLKNVFDIVYYILYCYIVKQKRPSWGTGARLLVLLIKRM